MKEEIEGLIKEKLVYGKNAIYGNGAVEYSIFAESRAFIYCNMFTAAIPRLGGMFAINSRQNSSYRDNYNLFCEDLRHYIEN